MTAPWQRLEHFLMAAFLVLSVATVTQIVTSAHAATSDQEQTCGVDRLLVASAHGTHPALLVLDPGSRRPAVAASCREPTTGD